MSGFASIVNFDGAPVDLALLDRMTDVLEFRGPDGRHERLRDQAGFGFTLLRTTQESELEHQPCTFDQRVWIVGDVRLDARDELAAQLQAHGRDAMLARPDIELVLHAYHVWGEACVEHLQGDFAFVVWDASGRRLFGARDHMGVRPFYYAVKGSTVLVSNTLDCIRCHPAVSARRNESAIADFLLFEFNRDKATTFFEEIRRLPPGHCVLWTPQNQRMRQYWKLPIEEPLRYRRFDDYTEHFRDLLRTAVRDRLRFPQAAIYMSGGLDSPAIAVTACSFQDPASITAFTYTFDGFDQERHFAGLVARHLGIQHQIRDGIAEGVNEHWDACRIRTPEPPSNPMLLDKDWAFARGMARSHRVVFYGEGPDNALWYEWQPYLRHLARQNRWGSLVGESLRHLIAHRRLPLLSTVPAMLRERHLESKLSKGYPDWLNPDFEARLKLRERWADARNLMPEHPWRPVAYESLQRADWQRFLESLDPAATGGPIEFRHPYLDIRLLRYMLAVPPLPWCRRKYLIRQAMGGLLPEVILRRGKSPLYPDPWTALARKVGFRPLPQSAELCRYIDPVKVPEGLPESLADFRESIRPRSLAFWLQSV